MHVEVGLLDSVGEVGAGEHQVLEDTSEAHVLSRISNRRPRHGGDLGIYVHGCQNWLAIHHADVLKDVKSVLAMCEEELIWSLL
jgi:hypothetical protein